MKLKLSRALFTCSLLGVAACGGPLPEEEGVLPSKEVGQMAQLLRKPKSIPGEYIVVLREDVKDVALRGSSDVARELVAAACRMFEV